MGQSPSHELLLLTSWLQNCNGKLWHFDFPKTEENRRFPLPAAFRRNKRNKLIILNSWANSQRETSGNADRFGRLKPSQYAERKPVQDLNDRLSSRLGDVSTAQCIQLTGRFNKKRCKKIEREGRKRVCLWRAANENKVGPPSLPLKIDSGTGSHGQRVDRKEPSRHLHHPFFQSRGSGIVAHIHTRSDVDPFSPKANLDTERIKANRFDVVLCGSGVFMVCVCALTRVWCVCACWF